MGATVFVCSECGNESAKWHGQCPGCGEWNSLVEERAPAARAGTKIADRGSQIAIKPIRLADVGAPHVPRMSTGIAELDRVLGGGVVPGSLVLIGGSPGIGKSTITAGAVRHPPPPGPHGPPVPRRGGAAAGQPPARAPR